MSRATLSEVLLPALAGRHAIAGLVVLGWEDARAYTQAAEAEGLPVILQAGPGFRRHMPLSVIAAMFNHLAENASVPVVTHLDHSVSLEEIRQAIDLGFTSVMYDGSKLDLDRNIAETARAAEAAHAAGVSCEGEIGFVGYAEGAPGSVTDPAEAGRFAHETGVDALAISAGNVHLQTAKTAVIDFEAIQAIEAVTDLPLVLHGGSGISSADRRRLARETRVCKFNIGTELRMTFGKALRALLADEPALYDRMTILQRTEGPLGEQARSILRELACT